jgi:hypothetical protein
MALALAAAAPLSARNVLREIGMALPLHRARVVSLPTEAEKHKSAKRAIYAEW